MNNLWEIKRLFKLNFGSFNYIQRKLVAYKCFQMTFRIGNELWHMNRVQREKTTLGEIRVEHQL